MTQHMNQPPEAEGNEPSPDNSAQQGSFPTNNEKLNGGNGDDQSTVQVIRMLVTQGQEYAHTEVKRQKLRVRILGLAVRDAIILGLAAIFLLMGLLIALLIGGIWALAPYVGPIWALVIVLGGCFATIVLLIAFIRARITAALRQTFQRERG